MARSTRNAVILFKLESPSGTDAAPTNTVDALLFMASGVSCNIKQLFAERDVIRGGFGAPDKLPYTRRGTVNFSVDLAGSGTAGTAPAWGKILQCCAFAETVSAGTRVEYTPVSTNLKTATIWCYWDGALRKFIYNSGTVKLGMRSGNVPTLDFSFTGLVVDPSATSNPVPTLSAWRRPVAVGPLGTSTLKIGGTYSAGALSGGTDYHFSEFNLDLANSLQDVPLVTAEAIDIDNRAPSADMTIDMTAAQEVAMFNVMKVGTNTSVGLVHGTTAGDKVLVFLTGGVINDLSDAPQGNRLLTKLGMDLPPVAAANDELRIVAL